MPRDWEIVSEEEVDASPEQVWEAVTTGPGLNGWFIGSTEIQPGPSGTLRSDLSGLVDEFSVIGWEPGRRVAYRSQGPDGGVFALEYLVEGRTGGTLLRCVASGFLPGDDWEAEFDSLKDGGAMYFQTLLEYLTHFRGRTALVIDVLGPPLANWQQAWRVMAHGLGLNGAAINAGDQVRLTPAGLAPIEGVVYAAWPHILTVRTSDGLYRFLAVGPMALISHRIFSADLDRQRTEQAWRTWLSQLYA